MKMNGEKMILNWDEYFMGVALLSSFRSKDPNSRVGACIVNKQNHIVGVGYNGFPIGCSDDVLPWVNEGDYLNTKYPYVCHAELNAILNSTVNLSDSRMYLGLFPCNECAKAIIQAGIKEVIYLHYSKPPETEMFVAARRLFDLANIKYRQLSMTTDVVLDYSKAKI